ncbi:sulfotransferase family 2 domain-containing protein [Aliiroseovarius subalbicans]|uniref:sulfotransferase family 2 domain-containing protein n=1 Tax=Aliiroseovarius subalbicans TaxID=2925840 RepID=UPI001F571192|nr:sulfotransferase family 2 domain-containing protein [Aliiroseovarius subalbicans]MCI2400115.1 sulfotransferase family 2 domain-containing protein [Aliiroseovarius subalbicans]
MARKFDYFIIFAEMRTGSNFLESNVDQFEGLKCYGEAFNPYFMVTPKTKDLFGVTVKMRDADPMLLLERMKENTSGIPGFRFFHDHDPRVFDAAIDDPRCAKVVLTRNVVDAYVSRKIAWATDQWALNNVKDAKKQKVTIDPEEFERLVYRLKGFQLKVKDRLQRTGQTAFHIDYDETQDLDVLNGLGRFLGADHEITEFAGKYKKQNPEPLSEKVRNYDDLVQAAADIDLFDLGRVPSFEPQRTPVVPTYVSAGDAPLIYLPVRGGPEDRVRSWMTSLGEVGDGFTQKTLRQWKRRHKGHRSFTVLRHPVARLHAVFCKHFLQDGPETYWEIRNVLRSTYDVPLPEQIPDKTYDRRTHHAAFLGFVDFVKTNLTGQTGIRVDATWATQSSVIQGFGQFMLPDHIMREDQLEGGLANIAREIGVDMPPLPAQAPDAPYALADIYDKTIEAAVRSAYQRDYMMFGFGPWA